MTYDDPVMSQPEKPVERNEMGNSGMPASSASESAATGQLAPGPGDLPGPSGIPDPGGRPVSDGISAPGISAPDVISSSTGDAISGVGAAERGVETNADAALGADVPGGGVSAADVPAGTVPAASVPAASAPAGLTDVGTGDAPAPAPERRGRPDSKGRLLAAAVEYVAENGMSDTSLRRLAAALGTSHRMLIYHFGSKEGLLAEVVKVIDSRELASIDELERTIPDDPATLTAEFGKRFSDPSRRPYQRLLFEVLLHAMQERSPASPMMREATDRWLAMLERLAIDGGLSPEEAKPQARLGLAVARGLVMDSLITGEHEQIFAALERFMATYGSPSGGNPGGGNPDGGASDGGASGGVASAEGASITGAVAASPAADSAPPTVDVRTPAERSASSGFGEPYRPWREHGALG